MGSRDEMVKQCGRLFALLRPNGAAVCRAGRQCPFLGCDQRCAQARVSMPEPGQGLVGGGEILDRLRFAHAEGIECDVAPSIMGLAIRAVWGRFAASVKAPATAFARSSCACGG